jgi:hypothetical protein
LYKKLRGDVQMRVQRTVITFVFAAGLAAGLYIANFGIPTISPVEAKTSQGEPLISPTEARERDFYAPNSETLAP